MIGGWLAILALSLVAFAIAAFVLRLPREGFAVFAAVLLMGLVGYAWQGHPGKPGAPRQAVAETSTIGDEMVEARKQLFDPVSPKSNYILIADAFARQGQFEDAAGALRGGLRNNPDDLEGWLALAMALTGHADGVVTPAAYYSYGKAREIDPTNPGPDFFLGFSFLQSGEFVAARDTWTRLLENSPEDAPWREEVEARVARLDQMIANAPMLQ